MARTLVFCGPPQMYGFHGNPVTDFHVFVEFQMHYLNNSGVAVSSGDTADLYIATNGQFAIMPNALYDRIVDCCEALGYATPAKSDCYGFPMESFVTLTPLL